MENELHKIKKKIVVSSSAVSPFICFLKRLSVNLLLYLYRF